MLDDLPDDYDLVVIGTGFTESCIAAAASRNGKTVLHIDRHEHYGGQWASLGLESLNSLLETDDMVELRNGSFQWHTTDAHEDLHHGSIENDEGAALSEKQDWKKSELLQISRRFNIDLCPKIIYSTGPLVQLLISSNICRYAEFRAVDRVCTLYNGNIFTVPCSRSDVFNTKDLTIVEKRLLMKFLTSCQEFGENKSEQDKELYRGKTFREYMQNQNLTDKIATCIMKAIAICTEETSFEEGMEHTQRFLSSLGRYGNTPFLFPMYGSGEIPQCFCRLCAVFGGIYCLKRGVDDIIIDADTNKASLLLSGGSIKVQAKHVVASHGSLPYSLHESNIGICGQGTLVPVLSRGIFITSSPMGNEELNSGGGGVIFMRLVQGTRDAFLIQLSELSRTCPKGLYLFHITTTAISDSPEQDLQPFFAQIFQPNSAQAPHLLYSAYFSLTGREHSGDLHPIDAKTPVFCTACPYNELDYDRSITNARDIFQKLYGDAPFLPRAPDPEEIIIDDEDPRALNEHSLADDLREQLRELERVEQMQTEEVNGEQNNEVEMN